MEKYMWFVLAVMIKSIVVLNGLLVYLFVLYFHLGKTSELSIMIITAIIILDLGIIYGGLKLWGIEARIKDINNGEKIH